MRDGPHEAITGCSPDTLLTEMPCDWRELIAFFNDLDFEQFDRVWPAAVVSSSFEELFEDAECPRRMLSLVLGYVRARYEWETRKSWNAACRPSTMTQSERSERLRMLKRRSTSVLTERMRYLDKSLRVGRSRNEWRNGSSCR